MIHCKVGTGLRTLGADIELGIGIVGTAGRVVVCAVGTGVGGMRNSRSCLSCDMSMDGAVMSLSAVVQSASACVSLSAGLREGLVIGLCWKAMVSLSHLLLVDLK